MQDQHLDDFSSRYDDVRERYAGTTGDFADDDDWGNDLAAERAAYEDARETAEVDRPVADPDDVLF